MEVYNPDQPTIDKYNSTEHGENDNERINDNFEM